MSLDAQGQHVQTVQSSCLGSSRFSAADGRVSCLDYDNQTATSSLGSSRTNLREWPTSLAPITASADEIANSIFVSVLRKAAVPLGEFVGKQLAAKYGETAWLDVARTNFSRRIRQHLVDGNLRDVYVITEIILAHLDQVFLPESVDLDEVRDVALLLSKVTEELECVVQTRTWLFHTFRVSAAEVYHGLLKLRRLWRRFGLEDVACCSIEEISLRISVSASWCDDASELNHLISFLASSSRSPSRFHFPLSSPSPLSVIPHCMISQ